MNDEGNGHEKSRLDRIEGIIEAPANRQILIEDEFGRLLKAQVVMVDNMAALTVRVDGLAQRVEELVEVQKHSDQRLDALISVVDGVVRRGLHPPNDP